MKIYHGRTRRGHHAYQCFLRHDRVDPFHAYENTKKYLPEGEKVYEFLSNRGDLMGFTFITSAALQILEPDGKGGWV